MTRRTPETTLGGFKCDGNACDENGIYAPCIMIPYVGAQFTGKKPIMAQMDIHLCMRHMKSVNVDDQLRPDVKEAINECARANGGFPDFPRSYIDLVRCMSQEFLEFQKKAGLIPEDDALAKGSIVLPF